MIKKILVPTDGSREARKAAAYAAELAKKMDASLTLLGVINTEYLLAISLPAEVAPSGVAESTEDLLRQATEAYLDETLTECRNQELSSVSKEIRIGHPVEEILKEADAGQFDLIVMGSHGRSAIRAAVLGSVTYGVLHKDQKIPVLVVRR